MWGKLFITVILSVITVNQVFARELFRSEFDAGLLKYVGSGDRHPGGGYVSFLGGEIGSYYTPSPNPGHGDLSVQDVIIDNSSSAQGGPPNSQSYALKTHYVQGDHGRDFQRNTTIIQFPESQEVYIRLYQKWSSSWIWPTNQQKFMKIQGNPNATTQNFFFQGSGSMLVNYFDSGTQTSSYSPNNDDLPGGKDYLATDTWHEIQVHVKVSDPGSSNGILEYWNNGVLTFGLYNIENNNGTTDWIRSVQLQHVYQTGPSPTEGPAVDMPTWMKNVVVSTTFIPGSYSNKSPKSPIVVVN